MTWVSIILAALKALAGLASFLQQRQLIDAGEARAIVDGLGVTHARVQIARAARRGAESGGMPEHDPYRRD